MYDNNFEALLLPSVELLTSGHLFDEFLNNDSIVDFGFRRCHFNVVHRAEDNGLASG